jgi:Uma2 family endonuclease
MTNDPTTIDTLGEQRIMLSDVSWGTYGALVEESGSAGKRMTYDRGVLEIMSPMMPHETAKRLLGRMVERYTEICGIDIRSSASTTFRRSDLRRGFEADESYYITRAAEIRGKDQIDLSVDPPPDLVIEIEISRSGLSKLEIFASMGIPEVWRYDGQRLWIGRLSGNGYERSARSQLLASFPVAQAEDVLSRRATESETALVQEFARSITPPTPPQ